MVRYVINTHDEHEFGQTLGDSGKQGSLVVLWSMGSQRVRQNLATEHNKIQCVH